MDELYVVARRVMLDALEALSDHRESVIVVGAQALYLQVGDSELAIAPFTTDCDLALDPATLPELPPLELVLERAEFRGEGKAGIGIWFAKHPTPQHPDLTVQLDILVPQSVSPGKGRRAARLPGHSETAARLVRGLDGVVVDHDWMTIGALDSTDRRSLRAKVAGPAALLVAKLHKIRERLGTDRSTDKDALDVFRLIRALPAATVAERLSRLKADPRSEEAHDRALVMFRDLFHRGGEGTSMVIRSLGGMMDEDEVRLSCELIMVEILLG